MEDEEAGSFSPELLHGDEDEEAIDPEEDRAILERNRIQVVEEQQRKLQEAMALPPPEDNLEMRAVKAMELWIMAMKYLETAMKSTLTHRYTGGMTNIDLENQNISTVCTLDTSGTNTTRLIMITTIHPRRLCKVTNSIYSTLDLVDKTKAPVYTIERDGDSAETCIIRFHAGPPYEDIAFRIVNKEWEYSHKKGFKCTFERGILHVYFNFKRYRYRR
ncbi:putative cactin [Helianthus annuus]|nr:putative cactin [Helianthus annuus]